MFQKKIKWRVIAAVGEKTNNVSERKTSCKVRLTLIHIETLCSPSATSAILPH